jgi:phage-related protein
MASSFGGTVKLTGESEYASALKNINSNLKAVSSELKLVSTEFTNNGNKIGDLRSKNDALNKKLQEEQNIVKTCSDAIKDFTEQQSKNKNQIDKLRNSLEIEKTTLDKMKNSTTATSEEISKQEKIVADLSKELSKSETAYDSNSRKINDYKVKLNDAKTQCSDLSKEIQDNNNILSKTKDNFKDNAKSVKDFATEEEKAGNNTLTLGDLIKGNLISEGIIAGIKGLAGAMKTVGSALLDVGKSALDSYANYEQLVGGVETLFKDSSSVVENYANNAYKTAGLSANDYMETVTSFSASLLQSLNNDTAKSAEVADMAITDMSDNANKMGTDMSMIQSAYQGFAKQNYTMLDNLKLGYGGTKSEMERLLKDAQKISGVKYDISNLSDVYNAIHVIQGELGVTGTTAKEASTTIQGSISSMKSSWQNFLTGLASGQDISGLIDNLVQSAVTVMDNVLPVVYTITETIVAEVPNLINKLIAEMPKFVELISNTIETMIVGLQENLPKLMESVSQIIQTIIKVITDNLPSILQMGVTILVELANGIAQSLPTLIPQMVDAVVTMVDTLLDNIDLIIDAGIQLLIGLVDGLIEALPKLIDRIPEIIDKLVQAIANNLPKIIEAGITLTVKLAVGLVQAIPQLVAKIPQIIGSLVKGIGNYFGKMLNVGKELIGKVKDGIVSGISGMANVGKDLVKGLWNGIKNAKDWVMDKIKGFGSSIVKGIKGIFGIHSPSTVFRDEIGSNLAKGIGVGFTSEMKDVNSMIQNSLPTDFDISSNVNLNNNLNKVSGINTSYLPLISAFQEALDGMAFKIDGEKMGELIISDVERVIYS